MVGVEPGTVAHNHSNCGTEDARDTPAAVRGRPGTVPQREASSHRSARPPLAGAARLPRPQPSRGRNDLVPYRLAVGKQDRVLPRQIVGALANEGGLRREDFGRITIRPTFSLVELPAQIPAQTWAALRSVRIAGRPIDIELDKGPKGSGKPFGKRKGGPGARADGVKHDKRRKS